MTQEQSLRLGGYTQTYGYDLVGNPTTFRGVAQSFNNANQNTGTTYDGDGNPAAWNGNALTFDSNDKLTAIGSLLTAGYNSSGERTWKQNSLGQRTYFLYAGGEPVCELDATGTVTAVNSFGPAGLLSRRNDSTRESRQDDVRSKY